MSKRNDGTRLQDTVQAALQWYCENTRAYYHRFPDSKSASRFLQVQPGDFMLLVRYEAILIECKSTDTGEPFASSLANKAQLGKHRLWHRAGHPSYFIFADYLNSTLSLRDGRDVLSDDKVRQQKVAWAGSINDIKALLREMIHEM